MKGKPGARSLALIVRGAAAFLFGMLANTSFQVFNHRGVRLEGHTQPFETQLGDGRPRPTPATFRTADSLHAVATATLHDLLVAGSKRRDLAGMSTEQMYTLVPGGEQSVDTAVQKFKSAASLDAHNVWPLTYAGMLLGYVGRNSEAQAVLSSAHRRKPGHELTLQLLALLLEADGFGNQSAIAAANSYWKQMYDYRLQNTFVAEPWWEHGSSWFDIDVKGKGKYDSEFHRRMCVTVIRIHILNHFFPSEYKAGSNQGNHMLQHGWIAFKRIIPQPQLIVIQDWYRWLEEQDTLGTDPGPAAGGQAIRRTGTDERVARHLYGIYAPIISRALGRPVKPSYSFMGLYYNEADLKPHRDNTQCEYTLSMQVDLRPESVTYPIFICEVRKHSGKNWQESCSGLETEIAAETGDAVLLMGRFHTHRRDKLPKGAKSMSIFLHWVNIEYEGELKAGGHALSGYATSELLIPQPVENYMKTSPGCEMGKDCGKEKG